MGVEKKNQNLLSPESIALSVFHMQYSIIADTRKGNS